MSNVKKKTVKVHLFDVIAAMVYIGHVVTPFDIAEHIRDKYWADVDEEVLTDAVRETLESEIGGDTSQYGVRERNGAYWLKYSVNTIN